MNTYDVVIVGGGAAGLSAALVLGRAGRAVAVVDGGQPRNAPAAHMQGYLSRDGMPPSELLAAGRAEVLRYGVQHIEHELTLAERNPNGTFRLTLATEEQLEARRVLVTTGLVDELPAIDGLRARWGKDVLHCPYCHGYEVRGKRLAVLGGTPESAQHALLIRQWSSDVVYFPHTDTLSETDREQLTARAIGIVEGQVGTVAITQDHLSGIQMADGRLIARDAAFVRPVMRPNSALLEQLECATDARGWVEADATGLTSQQGVWVAGNVRNPRAQVITAAGEGSAAAIAINNDLVADDVRQAVTTFNSGS